MLCNKSSENHLNLNEIQHTQPCFSWSKSLMKSLHVLQGFPSQGFQGAKVLEQGDFFMEPGLWERNHQDQIQIPHDTLPFFRRRLLGQNWKKGHNKGDNPMSTMIFHKTHDEFPANLHPRMWMLSWLVLKKTHISPGNGGDYIYIYYYYYYIIYIYISKHNCGAPPCARSNAMNQEQDKLYEPFFRWISQWSSSTGSIGLWSSHPHRSGDDHGKKIPLCNISTFPIRVTWCRFNIDGYINGL